MLNEAANARISCAHVFVGIPRYTSHAGVGHATGLDGIQGRHNRIRGVKPATPTIANWNIWGVLTRWYLRLSTCESVLFVIGGVVTFGGA